MFDRGETVVGISIFLFFLLLMFAWVTHIVVSIKTSAWVLMLFGIFVPPIGFIHGIGNWFGVF